MKFHRDVPAVDNNGAVTDFAEVIFREILSCL